MQNFYTCLLVLAGYTFFALFEYLVVISNMAFHLTAMWDFKSQEIAIVSSSDNKNFWPKPSRLDARYPAAESPDHSNCSAQEEEDGKEDLFHISPWQHASLDACQDTWITHTLVGCF